MSGKKEIIIQKKIVFCFLKEFGWMFFFAFIILFGISIFGKFSSSFEEKSEGPEFRFDNIVMFKCKINDEWYKGITRVELTNYNIDKINKHRERINENQQWNMKSKEERIAIVVRELENKIEKEENKLSVNSTRFDSIHLKVIKNCLNELKQNGNYHWYVNDDRRYSSVDYWFYKDYMLNEKKYSFLGMEKDSLSLIYKLLIFIIPFVLVKNWKLLFLLSLGGYFMIKLFKYLRREISIRFE